MRMHPRRYDAYNFAARGASAYMRYSNQQKRKAAAPAGGRKCAACARNSCCPKPSRTGNHADCFRQYAAPTSTQTSASGQEFGTGQVIVFVVYLIAACWISVEYGSLFTGIIGGIPFAFLAFIPALIIESMTEGDKAKSNSKEEQKTEMKPCGAVSPEDDKNTEIQIIDSDKINASVMECFSQYSGESFYSLLFEDKPENNGIVPVSDCGAYLVMSFNPFIFYFRRRCR